MMADVLQVFKQALIAKKAADEAAAADADAKIERGRRVDSITRNFQIDDRRDRPERCRRPRRRLEGIRPARCLTTAERAADRSPRRWRRRSEEASTSVQSVARPPPRSMASSVGEISRPGAGIGPDGHRRGRSGPHHQRSRQRVVESGKPHRRRGRADQHHRRPDHSAGAQRLLSRRRTGKRFGEAGRGFAVVASEVKGAGRADRAKATPGEIGQQITGIQAARPRTRSERHQGNQRHHRDGCPRSPRPLPRRWKSGAPPTPGNLPQRAAGRPGHPARSPPTSPTSIAGPAKPARPRRRCAGRASSRCPPTATASSSRSASSWTSVRAA